VKKILHYLSAGDANMYCLVDKDKLQREINNFVKWTNKWQVSLNINRPKCKIMSVHYRRYSNMGMVPNYSVEEDTEI